MKEALAEAMQAEKEGEVPIGAVVVMGGRIIGRGRNCREDLQQTYGHAEMIAIEQACRALNSWKLDGCDIYVTSEPCPMCAGAIVQARIARVYYGVEDPKAGSFGSLFDLSVVQGLNHYPEIHSGVMEAECRQLLEAFFKKLRSRAPK